MKLVPQDLDQALQQLGPEILLPTRHSADDKIAEVGDVVIRKSHVYDRWLERDPKGAHVLLDELIFDILLAHEAKRHGITIDPEQIDKAAEKEIKRLQEQVEKQWRGEYTFAQYCEIQFGRTLAGYRQWLRLDLARDLYRCYVIRYLAMLEDRVQVRLFAHADRKVVEDVRRRAQEGADFKSLVLRKGSQHRPSARNGGLMPPFRRDYPSPLTEHAFRVKPGDVSDVIEVERGNNAKTYFVLYCLKQIPARKGNFKEVQKELDEELRRNPVTPEEREALYLRLRSEALKNPKEQR